MTKFLLKVPIYYLFMLWVSFSYAKEKNPPLPYKNWSYVFVYPKALFAEVTFVRFLDTDGYLNTNPLPDLTTEDKESVNSWRRDIRRRSAISNKGKMPPQWIQFCWDSLVDKKVYQTTIEFPPRVWSMMRTPVPASMGPYFHDNMVIGLAPSGKVRSWFNMPGENNILIGEVKTVSGRELTICKNKMAFKDGYPASQELLSAIRGKNYPYGRW
ncbi:DUF2931 family protein [Candidatus Pantoea formicae]|uniref:DUF2931 family protein n=1 Tax=Candidatus Pantoea formicae TaxID=2608355 RepID=UPI003EDB182B